MNNEILVNKRTQKEGENKISHYIPLGFQKRKESIFIQKGKEFLNGKKSVSMKHIFDNNDKISIKINQNININTNIKNIQEEKEQKEKEKDEKEKEEKGKNELKKFKRKDKREKTKVRDKFDQRDNKTNIDFNKDNESKPQSDEDIFKIKKMKSCVFNYESEKKKEKKINFTNQFKQSKK